MCSAREAMATRSFVGLSERENGLEGSGITAGVESELRRWTCRVESHDALITMECSLLYTTDLTPASWLERTVWVEVFTSILYRQHTIQINNK